MDRDVVGSPPVGPTGIRAAAMQHAASDVGLRRAIVSNFLAGGDLDSIRVELDGVGGCDVDPVHVLLDELRDAGVTVESLKRLALLGEGLEDGDCMYLGHAESEGVQRLMRWLLVGSGGQRVGGVADDQDGA